MRITLTLDDDVHAAAKELASTQGKSIGQAISTLARKALSPKEATATIRNGIPLLPVRRGGSFVTSEIVRKLHEQGHSAHWRLGKKAKAMP